MSCDQNVDLLERCFEAFFEVFEESCGRPIICGNDFYLDDVVNVFHAAVFPSSLIRGRQRTDSDCAKGIDQFFLYLPDFLGLDVLASLYFKGK